jgi:hypothetical protein
VFKIDPTLATPISYSTGFDLNLIPFSRNVIVRALEHGFSIMALSINGTEPLSDPQVIYDGTYQLGKRIHILTVDPPPAPAEALVQYLLSTAGQAKIAEIKLLPLPEVSSGQ